YGYRAEGPLDILRGRLGVREGLAIHVVPEIPTTFSQQHHDPVAGDHDSLDAVLMRMHEGRHLPRRMPRGEILRLDEGILQLREQNRAVFGLFRTAPHAAAEDTTDENQGP